ncbi:MAG TPA: FecR domain-containing protein [Steroidobacteraceae bacterium]|nr:FecR domain-containing protein [Steroidobacteraceae bacterium]
MAELHRLPDLKRIELEASEWIARLRADDASAEDLSQFEAWRAAHALHARAYAEMEQTWSRIASAGRLVRAVSFAHSMNQAAAVPHRSRRWWWATAAGAVLAVVAASLLYTRGVPERSFSTAVGERATIVLADGSSMELNSGSLARVKFTAGSRVIRLERGEAFFQVAHDPQRPFWVIGGGSWVRAVGTAFNVYLRADGVRVTVSEGTVRIGTAQPGFAEAPTDQQLAHANVSVLTAGNQADIRKAATTQRQLGSSDMSRLMAWRGGTVNFENQPLGDVVDELGRYTPLQLLIEDPKLRALPVGGSFAANAQGADSLLVLLQQGFGLSVRRQGDRVYIEQKN